MDISKKKPCRDCSQCQMCSESRCRACRKGGHDPEAPELGPAMTFGEYLSWRERKECGGGKENAE